MINIKTSRYRNDAITQMSDVRHSRFLGQSVDNQALQQINDIIAQLEQRTITARAAMESIVEEETALKRAREVLLTQRNQSHQIMSDKRLVKSRLERICNQLNTCNQEAINLVDEERIVKEKCGVSTCFI